MPKAGVLPTTEPPLFVEAALPVLRCAAPSSLDYNTAPRRILPPQVLLGFSNPCSSRSSRLGMVMSGLPWRDPALPTSRQNLVREVQKGELPALIADVAIGPVVIRALQDTGVSIDFETAAEAAAWRSEGANLPELVGVPYGRAKRDFRCFCSRQSKSPP